MRYAFRRARERAWLSEDGAPQSAQYFMHSCANVMDGCCVFFFAPYIYVRECPCQRSFERRCESSTDRQTHKHIANTHTLSPERLSVRMSGRTRSHQASPQINALYSGARARCGAMRERWLCGQILADITDDDSRAHTARGVPDAGAAPQQCI